MKSALRTALEDNQTRAAIVGDTIVRKYSPLIQRLRITSKTINLKKLRVGDVVRHKMSGEAFVVVQTCPSILAVRHITVSSAWEWVRVKRKLL